MRGGLFEPLCGSPDNANIAFSPQSVNIRLFFWISGACSRIYRNDRTGLWLYYTKCSLRDNIGKNGAGYCICVFFFMARRSESRIYVLILRRISAGLRFAVRDAECLAIFYRSTDFPACVGCPLQGRR